MKNKEIKKSNFAIFLLYTITGIFFWVTFGNAHEWYEGEQGMRLFDIFQNGFCFSPDLDNLYEKAEKEALETKQWDEVYKDSNRIVMQYYQKLLAREIGGEKISMFIYSYSPVLKNKEVLGVSYHTMSNEDILSHINFNVTNGRMFEGNKREAVIINGNKNKVGGQIEFKSKDGNKISFEIVGRIKTDYLPNGWSDLDGFRLQTMEVKGLKSTVYLLNPQCDRVKSAMESIDHGGLNAFFESEDKQALENLQHALEPLGSIKSFSQMRTIQENGKKQVILPMILGFVFLAFTTILDFYIQKAKFKKLYTDREGELFHWGKRSFLMFRKNLIALPFIYIILLFLPELYPADIVHICILEIGIFYIINFCLLFGINYFIAKNGKINEKSI